jgi:hypothetical protein
MMPPSTRKTNSEKKNMFNESYQLIKCLKVLKKNIKY